MDKNRFKQLLESTLGNVKPLIYEDVTTNTNGDYKSTGGDPEKYNQMMEKFSKLVTDLNQNYSSSSTIINPTRLKYLPNVSGSFFFMSINLL